MINAPLSHLITSYLCYSSLLIPFNPLFYFLVLFLLFMRNPSPVVSLLTSTSPSSILFSHLLLLSTSSSHFLSPIRLSLFLSFWGILVLMPIYMTSNVITKEWDRYTLSNVVSGDLRIPPLLSMSFYILSSHSHYPHRNHSFISSYISPFPPSFLNT